MRVAVLGSGPIGLVLMMAARAFGAEWVAVTGISCSMAHHLVTPNVSP
jgi:threonine dehydrogenase-like Zn-dependent dehydrogenase